MVIGRELQPKDQEDQHWLMGDGAVVFENWVVIGQGKHVDAVADWEQSGLAVDHSAHELKRKVLDTQARFGELKSAHAFDFKRGRAVKEDLSSFATNTIYQALPRGWFLQEDLFREIKAEPELLLAQSRPIQLMFHIEKAIENFSENAELTTVKCFADDLSKKIVGTSLVVRHK